MICVTGLVCLFAKNVTELLILTETLGLFVECVQARVGHFVLFVKEMAVLLAGIVVAVESMNQRMMENAVKRGCRRQRSGGYP